MAATITEIENKNIVIKKVRMNTDEKIDGLEKPLQSYNFFYTIIGPPRSGKTNLLINLITTKRKYYYKKFDRVEFFSPSRSTIAKKIDLPDNRFHDKLDFDELEVLIESLDPNEQTLMIFDDCISSIKKNCEPFLKLIYNRRHKHISIILVSQVYNKIPLEIRKCTSMLFYFKNSNKHEIESVYEDFSGLSKEAFYSVCKYVFTDSHNFLLLDINDDTYYKNFNRLVITENEST